MGEYRSFVVGVVRVFVMAFVGVFAAGMTGLAAVPDYSTGKAAAIALVAAALSAGVKAVVDSITEGKTPLPGLGLLSRKTLP